TVCWRPTSSSGPQWCSTSPRYPPTCSRRCSPVPAPPGGARTSSSRSEPAGSSGHRRSTPARLHARLPTSPGNGVTNGHIGLLGGGVIGGGWAARFLLNGHDVVMFDPDPEAPRKVGEVMANARRAYGKLTMVQWPAEGSARIVTTGQEAGRGVQGVQ